jgi:hypothetical protein
MKPYVKLALLVVTIIAIGGIFSGVYMYTKQHKDLLKTEPDYIITSTDLLKEFENNESAAIIKFTGKIIEVNGIIASVTAGEANALSISLETGSGISSVLCTFPSVSDRSLFKPGKKVTVRGECSGYLMDILMNNCVVIN